jgi:hypothetical protein
VETRNEETHQKKEEEDGTTQKREEGRGKRTIAIEKAQ